MHRPRLLPTLPNWPKYEDGSFIWHSIMSRIPPETSFPDCLLYSAEPQRIGDSLLPFTIFIHQAMSVFLLRYVEAYIKACGEPLRGGLTYLCTWLRQSPPPDEMRNAFIPALGLPLNELSYVPTIAIKYRAILSLYLITLLIRLLHLRN